MPARILVVEDDVVNLKLMCYLLRAFGHEVLGAADGAAGLEVARREALDLIVCDIQLPKVDGYQVARTLKADPVLSKLPLVAVTALAMVGDRDKVLSAGFDGYMTKPIVPRTFVAQIEDFLAIEQRTKAPEPVQVEDFLANEQTTKAPEPVQAEIKASPRAQRRATILVVDDLPVNIELARKILGPSGYEVYGAASVKDGLAFARKSLPDLILCDVHMPEQTGFELLKAVKSEPVLEGIPFILISSSGSNDQDRIRALALGASKFLLRPIPPQKFLGAITDCLEKRQPKTPLSEIESGLDHREKHQP